MSTIQQLILKYKVIDTTDYFTEKDLDYEIRKNIGVGKIINELKFDKRYFNSYTLDKGDRESMSCIVYKNKYVITKYMYVNNWEDEFIFKYKRWVKLRKILKNIKKQKGVN